jgi:hypothetical protein
VDRRASVSVEIVQPLAYAHYKTLAYTLREVFIQLYYQDTACFVAIMYPQLI